MRAHLSERAGVGRAPCDEIRSAELSAETPASGRQRCDTLHRWAGAGQRRRSHPLGEVCDLVEARLLATALLDIEPRLQGDGQHLPRLRDLKRERSTRRSTKKAARARVGLDSKRKVGSARSHPLGEVSTSVPDPDLVSTTVGRKRNSARLALCRACGAAVAPWDTDTTKTVVASRAASLTGPPGTSFSGSALSHTVRKTPEGYTTGDRKQGRRARMVGALATREGSVHPGSR